MLGNKRADLSGCGDTGLGPVPVRRRCRGNQPFGNQALEWRRGIHWDQACDRPTSVGDREFFASLNTLEVAAEVVAQITDSSLSHDILQCATYVALFLGPL